MGGVGGAGGGGVYAIVYLSCHENLILISL